MVKGFPVRRERGHDKQVKTGIRIVLGSREGYTQEGPLYKLRGHRLYCIFSPKIDFVQVNSAD